MKKLLFMLITLFCSYGYAESFETTLTSTQISKLRVSSSYHSNAGIRQVALLMTSSLNTTANCVSGLFLETETNGATYSALLAAYMAGKTVNVEYDNTTPTPWASSGQFCALTFLDIVN